MKKLQWLMAGVMMALCQGGRGQSNTMFFRLNASTTTVITAMSPQGVVTWSNATAGVTTGQVQKATTLLGQSNWVDYVAFSVTGAITQLRLIDPNPPANMVYIPAGTFTMGDTSGDGDTFGTPVHSVNLSAFYMDKYEVTKALWDEVYSWATNNGYSFENVGAGRETNHPVFMVHWYDCVKWCNARSEKEGITPAYYANSSLITVYRMGQIDLDNNWVKWNEGYRLPTEAEWEYAARGGLSGMRFPWGDTITQNQANYYSDTSYGYDVSVTRGYHFIYQLGGMPYTSPVGSFAPNGYGLFGMSGNVAKWCWDWYGGYKSGRQTNPRGATVGSGRVLRGGCWGDLAFCCRTTYRYSSLPEEVSDIGFRTVRAPAQ